MGKKQYNKWISVKDELPEYEEVVLVCNEDKPSGMWLARRSSNPYEITDSHKFVCFGLEVTHWTRVKPLTRDNMARTKFKKIPFDLELAKKITNKEVKGRIVTRDGRQVRIICFDKIGVQGACQIVALFRVHPDEETVFTFSNEGVYRFGNKTCYDLFLEVTT